MKSYYSYDREKLANFLARIASEIREGKLVIKGEEIELPLKFDVEYEYEADKESSEVKIEFKW